MAPAGRWAKAWRCGRSRWSTPPGRVVAHVAHAGAVAERLALGGKRGAQADFDAVRPGAPRRYTVLRAGAPGQHTLCSDDARVAARFSVQHSANALVPGEQFGVGARSRCGYRRELAGDGGWQLALGLFSPRLGAAWLPTAPDVRLLAFADAGEVHNQLGTACRAASTRCRAASLGIGCAWAGARCGCALMWPRPSTMAAPTGVIGAAMSPSRQPDRARP